MTSEQVNLDDKNERRESARHELARSLDRELDILAEERKERAHQLGLDPLIAPGSNKVGA